MKKIKTQKRKRKRKKKKKKQEKEKETRRGKMEQDLTLLTTEDICTPDNEPEGSSSAPGCSSPSPPKDAQPRTETPKKGQDERPKDAAHNLLRSYQFKIDLPTVVDVCSVVPIFETLPVKVIGFRCCGQKGFGFVVNKNNRTNEHPRSLLINIYF